MLSWILSTLFFTFILTIMTINFPTKSEKKTSLLIDALRIMAWEEYKATNKDDLKDLEYGGYQVFAAEWKDEELHNFTYSELVDFCKAIEYTPIELMNYRSEYYAKKNANSSKYPTNGNGNGNGKSNYANEEVAF